MPRIRNSPSGELLAGGGTPLAQVVYVDPRLGSSYPDIPADEQDGSIGAPYSTFAAALASVLQPANPLVLMLAPGNYSAAGNIDLSGFTAVHVKGMAAGQNNLVQNLGTISAAGLADLVLEDISVAGVSAAGVNVMARGTGNIQNVVCNSLQVGGSVPSMTGAQYQLAVNGVVAAVDIQGANCTFSGAVCAFARLAECILGGDFTVNDAAGFSELQNIHFGSIFTGPVGHTVTTDAWSADPTVGVTAFNGGVTVVTL